MAVTSNPVVSRKDAKEFARHIIEQGYKKTRVAGGFDKAYQSEVEIYVKDVNGARVSVDLFVNGMTSRGTKGSWSHEYIRDNSKEATVSGARSSADIAVPTKELLIAMKIHSGRDVDMRDMVMLSEGVDWDVVLKHVNRGEKRVLAGQLTDIIAKMGSEQFARSLQATFGLRRSMGPLISECRKKLSQVREEIEQAAG